MMTDHALFAARRWLGRGAALMALQLLAAAAYFMRPQADTVLIGAGFALLGGAVVLIGLRGGDAAAKQAAVPAAAHTRPIRRRALLAGGGALLLAVLWSAAHAGTPLAPPPIGVQLAVWAVGAALAAWAVGALPLPRAGLPLPEALALAGIALVALVVRAAGLDVWVRGLIDEAIYLIGIVRLWDAPTTGLLTSTSMIAPTTAVYTALNAASVDLLGASFIGLRALNVALGVGGVLALYGLARELFGVRIALAAALILATFPPHLHFTRIAMPQPADTLFGTLALWGAARALRTGDHADWARAGVCLSLTTYFYEGGRLLFPALMAVWLLWARRIGGLRRMVWAVALVAAPVYLTMLLTGTPFARRLEDVGLGAGWWEQVFAYGITPEALLAALRRLAEPLLVYVHQPDVTEEFYGGAQPMVLVALVPLLLAGAAAALRTRRGALPLLWALGGAFGNALLIVTGAHQRYVAVHPALALLLALGAAALVDLLLDGRAARVALVVVCIGVAAFQVHYYVTEHLPLFNVQFRAAKPYPDGVDAVLRAAETLPPQTPLIFVSSPPDNPAVLRRLRRFLHPERAAGGAIIVLDAGALTPEAIAALPHGDVALFIAPDALHTLDIFGQIYNLQHQRLGTYDIPDDERYRLFVASSAELG